MGSRMGDGLRGHGHESLCLNCNDGPVRYQRPGMRRTGGETESHAIWQTFKRTSCLHLGQHPLHTSETTLQCHALMSDTSGACAGHHGGRQCIVQRKCWAAWHAAARRGIAGRPQVPHAACPASITLPRAADKQRSSPPSASSQAALRLHKTLTEIEQEIWGSTAKRQPAAAG